jgi:transcription elongation factor Elf1
MSEKKVKQVCKCENCGNESEMVITCSLEEEIRSSTKPPVVTPVEKIRAKGHGVCTHCGNEADMWVDLET